MRQYTTTLSPEFKAFPEPPVTDLYQVVVKRRLWRNDDRIISLPQSSEKIFQRQSAPEPEGFLCLPQTC